MIKQKNKGESEEIRNDTREGHGQKKIVDTNEEIQMDICSFCSHADSSDYFQLYAAVWSTDCFP